MSVKNVTYYQVECDGCGTGAHRDSEFSAFADSVWAVEDASDQDWMTEIGSERLDFCPKCVPVSTLEAIARNDTDDHTEITKTGSQWVCDSCGAVFGQTVKKELWA